jgi:hypothetical protein
MCAWYNANDTTNVTSKDFLRQLLDHFSPYTNNVSRILGTCRMWRIKTYIVDVTR